ncbi:hypothetical protein SPRG_15431 [Saprolegnia parasitica CBS 223.65]|uniref:Uncharacterized protein n=1 Tax=Saprolegnia parasitica (strain CBS 223.65) TaxID=695850 RepID=A0A067BYP2_SAPPC|nr:hypothetical protein SPRG_15431 [Saprolegnia parasitica CBS 223.65]KDO19441.1 hypothetical protein SPRG_15431 [Saprolegnia parasitica CBS 223.65]|eukprot:XP_012209867.1 hypothetical protein SPRG_15431 [Saprolegnia parasitica CBS 223.65]
MNSMNSLVSACEAILEQPRAPPLYICTGTQGISPLPVVSLEGLPDALSWPVSRTQHGQLSAQYGKASVVPAADIHIANQSALEEALVQNVVHKLLLTLGIRASNVGAVLSHLCMDAVGSIDGLRASTGCIADAFGTLIVLLPSDHTGGVLTFQRHEHAITLPQNAAERPRGFDGVCINTTIKSTPITSGRRLALVFDLTGVHEPERGPSRLPLNRTGAAAKVAVLAARLLPECHRIACSLAYLCPAPSDVGDPYADSLFPRLRPRHKHLVNILVASDAFDIAVVRFLTKSARYDSEPDDPSSGEDRADVDNHVAAFEFHPSCNVPDLVAKRLVGVSAHTFLCESGHDELVPVSAPSEMALLFWPKRFRAGIVGMKTSMALLREAVLFRRTMHPLGLSSARELVFGTMAIFHSIASLAFSDERAGTARDGHAAAMGDVLCASNDDEVAAYFLSAALSVSPTGVHCRRIALTDAVVCVRTCVTKFGWQPLSSAIRGLLRRWLRSSTQRSHVLGLVSHLAGLSNVALAAVCREAYVRGGLLLPVPGMRDGDLVDIPFDPRHCADCNEVWHFLSDGTRLRLTFDRRACLRVRAVAAAHPTRLRYAKQTAHKRSLRKVQQPGRIRIAHAALAKRRHVNATTSYRQLEAFRWPTPGNHRERSFDIRFNRPLLAHSVNQAIAAYEAAIDSIEPSTKYIYKSNSGLGIAPLLRVDGVDLPRPLTSADVTRLAALAKDRGRIPAAKLEFLNEAEWMGAMRKTILRPAEVALAITTMDVDVVLSHLCVDATGDANALRPVPDDVPGSFGLLLLLLPHHHAGGALTFAHNGLSKSFKTHLSSYEVAATYHGTSISSAPIASGSRLALVFHLVGRGLRGRGRPPVVALDRSRILSDLTAIAKAPFPRCQRIAYRVRTVSKNKAFAFENLTRAERALVDHLVASHSFDVALIRFKTSRNDRKEHRNRVASAVPHPACQMPPSVIDGLLGKGAHAFIKDPTPLEEVSYHVSIHCPPTALLFWPKRFRAGIAGIPAALRSFEAGETLLGAPSARDLALSIIAIFKLVPLSVLVALGEVDLASLFLSDAVFVSDDASIEDVAPGIASCLRAFGWPALQPAMLSLVQRWSSHWKQSGPTCQLLASLAGITEPKAAVCPPLRQPFVFECIKALWDAMPSSHHRYNSNALNEYRLLLDAYVDDDETKHWLRPKLPVSLRRHVDAFLYKRRHGTCTLLEANTRVGVLRRLKSHCVSLVLALQSHPTLPSAPRYQEAILADMALALATRVPLAKYERLRPVECGSLLQILLSTRPCDAALLDDLAALSGEYTVGGILWFLKQQQGSPLDSTLRAVLSRFLASRAQMLLQATLPKAKATVDLIVALGLLAPGEDVMAFVQAWRAVANNDEVYAVIARLQTNCDCPDVLLYLVHVCRAAILQNGSLDPVPPLPDCYVFGNVALDPAHCDCCMAFDEFLSDGTTAATTMWGRICRRVLSLLKAKTNRLEKRDDDGCTRIHKVLPRGYPTPADLKRHVEKLAHFQQSTERLAMLNALESELPGAPDEVQDDEIPPRKRPRRDATM